MSDYTKDMTTEEMRKEIAEMIQSGEGFIATDEKLHEYVDDFISKVRADAIEELLKYLKSDKYDYWDIIRIAEQLKEQKND